MYCRRYISKRLWVCFICVFLLFAYLTFWTQSDHSEERVRVFRSNVITVNRGSVTNTNVSVRRRTSDEKETKIMIWKNGNWQRIPQFCSKNYKFERVVFHSPAGDLPINIHDGSKDCYVSVELRNAGTWEAPNFKVFHAHLISDPEIGLIDIGGHLGMYALTAAKLGRQVVSVDPLEENVIRFCTSVQENNVQDKITIFYSAVSDKRHKVSFKGNKDHIAGTRLVEIETKNNITGDYSQFVSETVLLDDLLPYIHFKKAVIKIDVEAHEYHALKGGSKVFETIDIKTIMMEWVNLKVTPFAEKLIDLLTGYGFKPYTVYISDKNRVPAQNKLDTASYRSWPFDVQWIKG